MRALDRWPATWSPHHAPASRSGCGVRRNISNDRRLSAAGVRMR